MNAAAKQVTAKQALHAADVAHVVRVTGCTEEQARAELIADEWDCGWAIAHIRDAQARGVY